MQPFNIYYRSMNPPLDDTPYINSLIDELIEGEQILINSFDYLLSIDDDERSKEIYQELINDSKNHIRLLKVIYMNLNNKVYEEKKVSTMVLKDIKSIMLKSSRMSKKYRKILYSVKSNVHRYMLSDIITDTTNNLVLLNMLKSE